MAPSEPRVMVVWRRPRAPLIDVGRVVSWLNQTLHLPGPVDLSAAPDPGTPLVLPYLSGERSTGWAATARAVFAGVSAASEEATPSDLAATGHPAEPAQPANSSVIAALILGLLAVTAGLAIVGIRRFARK